MTKMCVGAIWIARYWVAHKHTLTADLGMIVRILSGILLCLFMASSVHAGGTVSFILDNDVPFATDREYTNGTVFRYTTDVNQAPGFVRSFLTQTLDVDAFQLEYSFGQWIYTPIDKMETRPIPDERPYAAVLYGEMGATFEKADMVHRVSLMLGVFGPPALGEEIQNFVHSVRNLQEVLGWDNQLKTEPALNINYDVAMPLSVAAMGAWQLLAEPFIGVSLGNITTNARAGLSLRFGPSLNWQPTAVANRPGLQAPSLFMQAQAFRWHVYGTVVGRLEGYSTLIDGNLFRPSLSADRKVTQWEARSGAMISYGRYWAGGGVNFHSRSHDFQERALHKVFEMRLGVSFF